MDIDIVKHQVKDIITKNSDNMLNQSNKTAQDGIGQKKELNKADAEETEDIRLVYSDENTNEVVKTNARTTPKKPEIPSITANKTPRRVQLITLSSPKRLKK